MYLLVVDYARAGVVEHPSSEEFCDILRQINAGAIAGLRHLGLLPPAAMMLRTVKGKDRLVPSKVRVPAKEVEAAYNEMVE